MISDHVKKARVKRGLTLAQMAKLTGFSNGYLSQIERGNRSAPVSSLQKIATALGVELAEFFEGDNKPSGLPDDLDIVRALEESPAEINSEAGYRYRPMVHNLKSRQMSPFLMTIESGVTQSFSHDSEEFNYIVKGELDFEYKGIMYTLKEGDSVYYDSRRTHSFSNNTKDTVIVVAVNFNYRRF